MATPRVPEPERRLRLDAGAWGTLILGLLVATAGFVSGSRVALWNHLVVGAGVVALAALEAAWSRRPEGPPRWAPLLVAALGAWLALAWLLVPVGARHAWLDPLLGGLLVLLGAYNAWLSEPARERRAKRQAAS